MTRCWEPGTISQQPDGQLVFTVSGTNQALPVADGAALAKLKGEVGKEISLVARVRFDERPPQLVVE